MRIVSATAWIERMALSQPYQIAYAHVTHAENVIVRLETESGIVAYGVGCPETPLTGETAETIHAGLEGLLPDLVDQDGLERARIVREIRHGYPGRPALRASVDLALHDLLGKMARQPTWRLLGGYRREIPTAVTIGILDPVETVARARQQVDAGFRTLKLKGGIDPHGDVERVRRVREEIGPDIELWLDPNQGYGVEVARQVARALTGTIALLEQPTPRDDPEALCAVALDSPVPIYADESVLEAVDALRLAERIHGINIKIQKLGGLIEARRVTGICTAAGIDAMVGCMDECALGIAAGLQLALAFPAVVHADLDGHLDLARDPTSRAVVLERGVLGPTGLPGLGMPDLPAR